MNVMLFPRIMALSGPPSTTAQLIYSIKPADGARAFRSINADSKTGQHATNLTRLHKDVVIENLRGKEDYFTLDTAGFQLWNRPSKHKAFTDDADVEREYYPECIEFIKEVSLCPGIDEYPDSNSSSSRW